MYYGVRYAHALLKAGAKPCAPTFSFCLISCLVLAIRDSLALLKAGAKPSSPYIPSDTDTVLGFGISGQPLRSAVKHDIPCLNFHLLSF